MYSGNRFDWRPTRVSYLSVAVLLFTAMFGWLLPPGYGKENGPVEWLQVVVLSVTALLALSALYQTQLPLARRKLIASGSVVLLLAVARELSWGRVFYMTSTGSIPPLKTLWFGAYVFPLIGVVFTVFLGCFFTQGLHQELRNWFKTARIPVFELIMILGAIVAADLIEHHSAGLFGKRTELFEELNELVSYTGVLCFVIRTVFGKS